jgi:hypothetical protein
MNIKKFHHVTGSQLKDLWFGQVLVDFGDFIHLGRNFGQELRKNSIFHPFYEVVPANPPAQGSLWARAHSGWS